MTATSRPCGPTSLVFQASQGQVYSGRSSCGDSKDLFVLSDSPSSSQSRTQPPIVALRGVGKTFANGTQALDRLDLEVRSGEFLSVLGPSGCGKSTALRLIAGLSEPSRGTIAWGTGAEPPAGRGPHDIGFVFQEPTLMPWATVERNVALPLRLRGAAASGAQRIAAAIDRVGLSDFRHVYPRALSGGMKMRVSIARALVTDPKLLLMDEPFAALDEITRFKLNDDLLSLWQMLGKTVVFVTHSVFESVYLSQRIVVMTPRPGRVFTELAIDAPYPRELSGGMRMRVSIARALVTAPRILLMDEPFAALDEITRFKLNDDLVALWRELRMTVVFVTHSVFESVYLSTRIVVMTGRPGRVSSELAVDVPNRDARFRTSAEYAGYCRVASEALAKAMQPRAGAAA